ncbi:MAG TPA: hypothetical protein VG148_08550, partial [Pyrinomonadaceae bacterium]|nr:hypothetical protein [Pyrinomonadaceae bacterium]
MVSLLVLNCSQVVTLAGPARPRVGAEMRELGVVREGALLVRGGRVVRAGTRAEGEPLADAGTEALDAGGRVLMPGFVDAHA